MLTMQVIGNVGQDPEFKESQSGKKLCRLSLAANKKVKGEKVTTWVNVTVFDEHKIEFIRNYVRKGSKLFFEGEPEARGYEKDGEVRASLSLIAGFGSKIEICSSERADGAASTQDNGSHTQRYEKKQPASDGWGDDIPGWD